MTEDERVRRLADDGDGFVEGKSTFDRAEAPEVVVAFASSAQQQGSRTCRRMPAQLCRYGRSDGKRCSRELFCPTV